jgi:uncharacterized protein YjiS (DUF1127 family)
MHTPSRTSPMPASIAGRTIGANTAMQILQRLRRAAHAWRRRRDAARNARALQALDDRTLKDLGFTRSELTSLAHDPADVTRMRSLLRA